MNTPINLKYTQTDEWFDPATGKLGLTDFAQSQLSDIVFVEVVVKVGEVLQAGRPIASVESVKAAANRMPPSAPGWWQSMKSWPPIPKSSTVTPTVKAGCSGWKAPMRPA